MEQPAEHAPDRAATDSAFSASTSAISLPSPLTEALAMHWNSIALREKQLEAIGAVLAGRDSFVGLRTGYGKSLCFQLPAAARPGVTVVVTPLLALAQDQCTDCDERGIVAAKHTSDVDSAVRAGIVADLEGDDPETKLLYLTPEGLAKEEMQELLSKLNARRLLNAIAVDEVCVAPSAVHPLPASADLVLSTSESAHTPAGPFLPCLLAHPCGPRLIATARSTGSLRQPVGPELPPRVQAHRQGARHPRLAACAHPSLHRHRHQGRA